MLSSSKNLWMGPDASIKSLATFKRGWFLKSNAQASPKSLRNSRVRPESEEWQWQITSASNQYAKVYPCQRNNTRDF